MYLKLVFRSMSEF